MLKNYVNGCEGPPFQTLRQKETRVERTNPFDSDYDLLHENISLLNREFQINWIFLKRRLINKLLNR